MPNQNKYPIALICYNYPDAAYYLRDLNHWPKSLGKAESINKMDATVTTEDGTLYVLVYRAGKDLNVYLSIYFSDWHLSEAAVNRFDLELVIKFVYSRIRY